MRKISISLYIVILISLVSFSMMSAYAAPSDPDTDASNSSAVESTVTSSEDNDTTSSEDEETSSVSSDTSSEKDTSSDKESSSSKENTSSKVTSSKVTSTSSVVSSEPDVSSNVSSQEPVVFDEEDFDFGIDEDDEDYTHVTSDSLITPEDQDGDGVEDKKEEKMDNSVAKRISTMIWIPISLAVASAAALITINILYRKKYGKLISANKKDKNKKKSKKNPNLYIPRD